MPFFQVSGTDIFASVQVKTMLAHLNVLASETNFMAWARLLYGLGVFAAPASAREFMRKMLNRALLPSDFLLYDSTTYVPLTPTLLWWSSIPRPPDSASSTTTSCR